MRRLRAANAATAALLLLVASCGKAAPAPAAPAATPAPAAVPAPAPSPAPAAAPAAPAVTAPPKPAAPAPPTVISDEWYRTLENGQPSGWRHVKWTRTTYEGKPVIHDRTESLSVTTRSMGGVADQFESREWADLDRTEDGLVWRSALHRVEQERMSDDVQVWTGKGYELTSRDAGGEEKHFVACDAQYPADVEAFFSKKIAAGEVAVGQRHEHRRPNFLGERLDTVVLTVDAKETLELSSGTFECFRVTERVTGAPFEATWWLDTKGIVRKLRAAGSVVESATESEARDLSDGGAVYSITVSADPEMPRCTSLDRAVIDVKLAPREGVLMPDFPKTPFSHELSRDGDTIRVELTAHDEAPEKVVLPVTDAAFARHLERTNLFSHDAPRVKAALKAAVGDEKDPAQIVRKILRYVFVTLRKQSGPTPEPSAVEILEEGCGDCSEHCVLFVTLCRGAGIPARRLSGWAQVGDMWGSHSFAEVWLGRWIGCDPTTNEFGTKARYLAFGWNDDPDSFPGVVSSRISQRISIRTVEFAERGKTWKVEGLSNPSEREDVLSGIQLAAPPDGWHAGIAGGRGRVTGPGVRADVSVQSGFGDVPCDVLRTEMLRGWNPSKFAGLDALRSDARMRGKLTATIAVPYARRLLYVRVTVDDPEKADAALAQVATVIAPTLEPASQ
jgi:transglutaminase-like putative cysteine protease